MEAAVNVWLSQNNHDFLTVSEITDEFLEIEIHGKPLQLIIPSAFHSQSIKSNNSDEVFMVVRADNDSDCDFDSALYFLNEKLERVKVGPDCLYTVLDRIINSFRTYKCKKIKCETFQSSNSKNANDKRLIENGFLYKLAKEAQEICETVRKNATLDYLSDGISKSAEQILFWCGVSADPGSCTVQLEIELVGIIEFFHRVEALGFSSENPLKISLHFGKNFWLEDDILAEVFSKSLVSCSSQNEKKDRGFEGQSVRGNGGEHLYGPEVLVSELVMLFFGNGDDVTRLALKDFGNQFVQLLVFIGMRLSMLPSWCLICKKELGFSPSRLCSCNSPFCIYQFQKSGLGTTVLQEVHKSSEVVDFEISLAVAASKLTADVFEPLQAFFPENEEVGGKPQNYRDSGTKETGDSGNLQREHELQSGLGYLSNKEGNKKILTTNEKLKLLQNVIKIFPPAAEMQKCVNEYDLRVKLEESWFQVLSKGSHDGQRRLLEKDFVKGISLPYDVLRFILSTSRVNLHILEGDAILHIPESLCQFAVLHESPEEGDTFHNYHGPERHSFFAFHGCSVENLYSVLRNGLGYVGGTSNVSGRASHMLCINLSSHLSTALSYSTKSDMERENGTLRKGFFLAAICEVISRPGRFVDRSMMVSLETEDIALRYLIVFKDLDGYSNTHILDGHTLSGNIDLHRHYKHVREEYKRKEFGRCLIYKQRRKAVFDNRVVKTNSGGCHEAVSSSTQTCLGAFGHQIERETNSKTNYSMKTIMKEYHNLAKVLEHGQTNSTGLVGVGLKLPDENDICRWHVSLSQNLFKDYPLYKDLVECARKNNVGQVCILLELTFPGDYPFAPPFVRIVRPRFSRYTGHITVGGSICMELLTKSGWSPACSVESLLVQIQNAIIEGGGRLDQKALLSDNEYNVTEAREAFDRVALDHGWI